jgi:hypothetical protein
MSATASEIQKTQMLARLLHLTIGNGRIIRVSGVDCQPNCASPPAIRIEVLTGETIHLLDIDVADISSFEAEERRG